MYYKKYETSGVVIEDLAFLWMEYVLEHSGWCKR